MIKIKNDAKILKALNSIFKENYIEPDINGLIRFHAATQASEIELTRLVAQLMRLIHKDEKEQL